MNTHAAAVTRAERDPKFAVLLTTSMVSSLIMLDSNIVAVALPSIGRSLKAEFTDIQWVISAYVLTYAALLLAAGGFADLYGRRRAMLVGLIIFAVASAGCGVATSALLLNLSRSAQGVGGAFLLTASLAIISQEFTGEARSRALAFWGASLGIALAVGPIVGGAITNFLGWRWVFFVNVPLSLLLIGATVKVITESRDPGAKGLDYPGTAAFSCGLALLIWALIDANDAGWTSRRILGRFAAAAILLLGFVIAELRRTRPMIDLSLFKRRTFLGAVLAMIGYGASAQVMVFFLPLFLQNAYAYRPFTAGIAMLPFALPMVLAPRLTNIVASRYSGRTLLATGLAITVVGNVLFWLVAGAHLPYEIFVVSMLVAGAGAGLLNGQTVKVIGGAVPQERSGMASGIASTTRFIGILVSVAGMGAVLANVVHLTFESAAVRAGLSIPAAATAAKLVVSGNLNELVMAFPASKAEVLHAAGLSSFSRGFGAASLLAAAIALIACLLTLVLIRASETAPTQAGGPRPCKSIDCRDPL